MIGINISHIINDFYFNAFGAAIHSKLFGILFVLNIDPSKYKKKNYSLSQLKHDVIMIHIRSQFSVLSATKCLISVKSDNVIHHS